MTAMDTANSWWLTSASRLLTTHAVEVAVVVEAEAVEGLVGKAVVAHVEVAVEVSMPPLNVVIVQEGLASQLLVWTTRPTSLVSSSPRPECGLNPRLE